MEHTWLAYFPGSPFARMARVLVREWRLPVEEVEYSFPPTDALFEINPLGTVPVLVVAGRPIFPTLLVLERLWETAERPTAYDPGKDRQVLLTALQACEAFVSARYQAWAGLGPVSTNHVGYDPAERHMARVGTTLAWLGRQGIPDGVSLVGVAVACTVLWARARGGLGAPLPNSLACLIDALDRRPSFMETRPQDWSPD
jgi:glutathione S-transferase